MYKKINRDIVRGERTCHISQLPQRYSCCQLLSSLTTAGSFCLATNTTPAAPSARCTLCGAGALATAHESASVGTGRWSTKTSVQGWLLDWRRHRTLIHCNNSTSTRGSSTVSSTYTLVPCVCFLQVNVQKKKKKNRSGGFRDK